LVGSVQAGFPSGVTVRSFDIVEQAKQGLREFETSKTAEA
jgi:hypothetical protein